MQTLTYPLDLVRRRMQVQALAAAGAPALGNTWAALRDIARSAGWRGLFSGLSINYMKVGVLLPLCRVLGLRVAAVWYVASCHHRLLCTTGLARMSTSNDMHPV